MRGSYPRSIAFRWSLGLGACLASGCVYAEATPGAGGGEAGASAQELVASAGAAGQASVTTVAPENPRTLACQSACSTAASSGCPDAQPDVATCVTSCEAAAAGACGEPFVRYLTCASRGGEAVCTGYGPAVADCEDLFYLFIDCAL